MSFKAGYVLAAGVRVSQFIDAHARELGLVTKSGSRVALDQAIGRLRAYRVAQLDRSIGAQGETERLRATQAAIRRDFMSPIATIARQKLPRTPDFAALRKPGFKVVGEQFAAAARSMANAAAANREVFIAEGLPRDFVEQMNAAAGVLERTLAVRDGHRNGRVKATESAKVDVRTVREAIRVLDSLVRAALADYPALLSAWRSAKLVHVKPGFPAGSQPASGEATVAIAGVESELVTRESARAG